MLRNSVVNELSYHDYQKRQFYETSEEGIEKSILKIKPAGKYHYNNGFWKPVGYKGLAIVAMVDQQPEGIQLINILSGFQKLLIDNLDCPDIFYPLPVQSFHQTIANTFSDDRYDYFIANQQLDTVFPEMVNNVFVKVPQKIKTGSITLKLIGFSLFRTAIGILAEIPDVNDYQRLITIRDHIYNDQSLANIGLERTRPFIGHITFAYIERSLNDQELSHTKNVLLNFNKKLQSENIEFPIRTIELRNYEHLSDFLPFNPPVTFSLDGESV